MKLTESYWKFVEEVDRAEAVDGIKRGLESMEQDKGKDAERFFEEFFVEKRMSERD